MIKRKFRKFKMSQLRVLKIALIAHNEFKIQIVDGKVVSKDIKLRNKEFYKNISCIRRLNKIEISYRNSILEILNLSKKL